MGMGMGLGDSPGGGIDERPYKASLAQARGVLAQAEVSMGSGVRGTGIILQRADLMRGLGEVTVGEFCSAGTDQG